MAHTVQCQIEAYAQLEARKSPVFSVEIEDNPMVICLL